MRGKRANAQHGSMSVSPVLRSVAMHRAASMTSEQSRAARPSPGRAARTRAQLDLLFNRDCLMRLPRRRLPAGPSRVVAASARFRPEGDKVGYGATPVRTVRTCLRTAKVFLLPAGSCDTR